MVQDDTRREERALIGRAKEIEDSIGIKPRSVICVGDPASVLLATVADLRGTNDMAEGELMRFFAETA